MKEEDRILLVEQAAERAQLVETVRQMPNGFNTMIGDRSEENLSDGTVSCFCEPLTCDNQRVTWAWIICMLQNIAIAAKLQARRSGLA